MAQREPRVPQRIGIDVGGTNTDGVMIGTTHFTNAVVQRRHLSPVAAVRLGLPATACVPPLTDWPEDLRALVGQAVYMLPGGHEVDGRPIVPFEPQAMADVAY